jgi:hypothetical protein
MKSNAGTAVLCFMLLAAAAPAQQVEGNPTFATFDAPGAGTGASQGTFAISIDTAGVIAGYYIDASNAHHGFVRAADGTITTFDVTGAGAGAFQGTTPLGINTSGTVAGFYIDSGNVNEPRA